MSNRNISIELFECGCNAKIFNDTTGLTSICLKIAKISNLGIVEMDKAQGGFGLDHVLMGSGCCAYLFTFSEEKRADLEFISMDINDKVLEEIITTLVELFKPKFYKETISIHGEMAIKMPILALHELKDGKYITKKESPEDKPSKKESKKPEKPEEKPEKTEK